VAQDNIVKLSPPGTFSDPLTEVLRNGARALLAHAVEAEVAGFLGGHADKLTDDGHRRLVRHGHLPEREIMTGIGAAAVRCPRVRDRAAAGGERIRFSSAILPPYARRSKSLEVLIPILYLKGISTGDFEEALAALLGKDAGGLSASTIARLKEAWADEHARWLDRDLSANLSSCSRHQNIFERLKTDYSLQIAIEEEERKSNKPIFTSISLRTSSYAQRAANTNKRDERHNNVSVRAIALIKHTGQSCTTSRSGQSDHREVT
jgi:hypothetical protein